MKREIKRCDVTVIVLVDAMLKKVGSSTAALKENAERLWDHLNPDEGEDAGKSVH